MYMARDDRDKEFSYFGNNQTGGELVKIKLVEMKAPNVFLATLSNGRSGLKTQGPIGKRSLWFTLKKMNTVEININNEKK